MVGQSEGSDGSGHPPATPVVTPRGESMRAQNILLRSLCACAFLLLPLLGSCASTGPSAEETAAMGAVRASLLDYNGGTSLVLVNETYATRHAGESIENGLKVASDEVLAEVAKFFAENDFWAHARTGKAQPMGNGMTDGGQRVSLVLELGTDQASGYLPLRVGLSSEEIDTLQVLITNYTALWSEIEGYHAVFNPSGENVFRQPIVR